MSDNFYFHESAEPLILRQRDLEEARKQMTKVQGTFIKAEPWLVKNEVIDLTLD